MKKPITYAVACFALIHFAIALSALGDPVREAVQNGKIFFWGLPAAVWVRFLWTSAQSTTLVAIFITSWAGMRSYLNYLEKQAQKEKKA